MFKRVIETEVSSIYAQKRARPFCFVLFCQHGGFELI